MVQLYSHFWETKMKKVVELNHGETEAVVKEYLMKAHRVPASAQVSLTTDNGQVSVRAEWDPEQTQPKKTTKQPQLTTA